MTDRGTGMYSPSGQVVAAYEAAVRECNFQLFWGPDAKQQAADMPDLLLHETAVSWFRCSLRKSSLRPPLARDASPMVTESDASAARSEFAL